jgi:flagellar assembly protein FliH
MQWPTADAVEFVTEDAIQSEEPGETSAALKQRDDRIASLERELARAKQEVEQRVRDAEMVARKEAEEVARAAADATIQAELAKIGRMMNDIAVSGSTLRRQAEEDLVRLSIAIARRILHREISIDPDALLGLVKAAMSKIDSREIHLIRAHPDTVPVIQKALNSADTQARIEISVDPRAERGTLLIETARGQLDASLETQLLEVQRGFTDLVTNGGAR